MTYEKKYKWALSGFIIMLIMNIAVLTTIFVVKQKEHRHDERNGSVSLKVQRFIEHELDLSDAQKKEFKQLRQQHFKETKILYKDIGTYRKELFSELKGGEKNGSAVRIDSLTNLIGDTQTQLDRAVYSHFVKLRSICNEEQRQKFDQIMQKVMQRLDPERFQKEAERKD